MLIGFSFVISLLLWFLFQLLLPFLPQTLQHQLDLMQSQTMAKTLHYLKQSLSQQPFLSLYFIALQIAQVLLAPIPGQLMGLLGGWLFGFWQGLGLTMVGLSVGSMLAMLLGRYGGRPLIEKFLSPKLLIRFDYMVHTAGLFSFFMLFLLPALPDDALCMLAGLTRYRLRYLIAVCILGRLPGMAVLSWVGTELGTINPGMNILLIGLGLLSFLLWLFQDQVEKAFSQWTKPRTRPLD